VFETLHIIGKLPNVRRPTVAIVGTCKPTAYGKALTYQLAYDLAKQEIVIISGLALGVDGNHRLRSRPRWQSVDITVDL
jgi:DNA processing protein